MKNKNYREKILKKINLIKKIILGAVILYILFISVIVCISYGFTGKMSVNEFSVFAVVFSLIGIAYFSTSCLSFLRRYREVIIIISDEDLAAFETLNKSLSFIQEYFPSFIIYSGMIRVFKFRNHNDLYFKDLSGISIKTFYNRSGQNHIAIFKNLNGDTSVFGISNNISQQKYLTQRALENNPNIMITY